MSSDIETFRNRVLDLLNYDPETGVFTWKVSTRNRVAGSIAGYLNKHGYIRIDIDGKYYQAPSLVWLIVTGSNPIAEIDHIDNDKVNNKLSNLREASRSQNEINIGVKHNNKSGYLGVSWVDRKSKWLAQVTRDKVRYHVGWFDDPREAAIARDKAAIRLHGEYSRLNFKYVIDEEGQIELDE